MPEKNLLTAFFTLFDAGVFFLRRINRIATVNVVNISDRQSASHAPFVPIASGNRIKHGIRKTNPRNRANKLASFTFFTLW